MEGRELVGLGLGLEVGDGVRVKFPLTSLSRSLAPITQGQAQSIDYNSTEFRPKSILGWPQDSVDLGRGQATACEPNACVQLVRLLRFGVHVYVEGGRVAHPRQHACTLQDH